MGVEAMAQTKRRRHYFLAKKFQLRYAGLILIIAFVAALVSGITVFYTMWDILGEKLAAVYPHGLFDYTFKKVMSLLARNMGILTFFIFAFGILISHRIAGPVYRLKRVIREMGEGNLDSPVYLRRTDELHDLAEEINEMQRKLRMRFNVRPVTREQGK